MPCSNKNQLIREGTSLTSRVLAALSPDYVKVDERLMPEMLLFAKKYAKYLNYYNIENKTDGDWEVLMKMDISVVLAALVKINAMKISGYKRLLYRRIKTAASEAEAKNQFGYLFDLLFSLSIIIDEQYSLLPDQNEYKKIIGSQIQNKLKLPLANLEKCFTEFNSLHLLDYSNHQLDGDAPIETVSAQKFDRNKLDAKWNSIAADLKLTIPALADVRSVIIYVINHNLFNAQVDFVINAIAEVVRTAEKLFSQTLEDFPEHSPHYALFISFLKLFRFAQDSLNTYTGRHLDFYYKDVLKLVKKEPEADSVHLVFELQKGIDKELVEKGTLFKGGKDTEGIEIQYSLKDDLALNKAQVKKIQSWQMIKRTDRDILIASPAGDSEDGQGGKLVSADKSWFTFGNIKKAEAAEAGFAIASNILYLNERERTITLTVNFTDDITDLNNSAFDRNCFYCTLTGKKGWQKADALQVSFPANHQMKFVITLEPNAPAVIPYSEKIHKEKFDIALPLLKIFLDQNNSKGIPYSLLCKKQISSLSLKAEVKGMKNLVLSNDTGNIDYSKPFKPFGDFPGLGAPFYIGSREIFQKPLTSLSFNFNWKDEKPQLEAKAVYLRESNYSDEYTLDPSDSNIRDLNTGHSFIAAKNAFHAGNSQNKASFTLAQTSVLTDQQAAKEIPETKQISFPDGKFTKSAMDFTPDESLNPSKPEGSIRLKNNKDYSQKTYINSLIASMNQTEVITDANNKSTVYVKELNLPPEIILNSLNVDYLAEDAINFTASADPDNNIFYHITPFGYYNVRPDLLGDDLSMAEKSERLTLIPNISNAGELFIGLENAEPDSVVTLLFQVSEGSSDPLKDMEELSWFYLADNNWLSFSNHQVTDGTKNFTRSGIVTITLPGDISDSNTAFEEDLYWIKCALKENTGAVCKMILIKAQAGCAELVQDETRNIEFRQTLPAKTISKPVVNSSAIKSISQPSDSFDGRKRESDEEFYQRVSERLRHKQRAVNIWDYEHIILEKFQNIYEVKCLNHSGFIKSGTEEVFCENLPGHVTIITIPDFRGKTNINPLRPYTPIGLLKDIEDYLKTISSPFVKLHVRNPLFEEIRLSFKVKFYDNCDSSTYHKLLNLEIEKFLTPWAWSSQTQIPFGRKIVKSVLLNFVEERPYVDFVSCFKMDHIIRQKDAAVKLISDVEEAVGSTSRSILVSYYDDNEIDETKKRHLIDTNLTCKC